MYSVKSLLLIAVSLAMSVGAQTPVPANNDPITIEQVDTSRLKATFETSWNGRTPCRCGDAVNAYIGFTLDGKPVALAGVKLTVDDWKDSLFSGAATNVPTGGLKFPSSTLAKPGFLRFVAKVGNLQFMRSVPFEPERLVKGSPTPADLESYWKGEMAKLKAESSDEPTMTPVTTYGSAYDAWRISFATAGGKRVYGVLTVPKNRSKGPFPVRVEVPSAGQPTPTYSASWIYSHTPEPNAVAMTIFVHCDEIDIKEKRDAYFARIRREHSEKYGLGYYPGAGISDGREAYHFYPIFLGASRAVEWLHRQSYVDKSRFTYQGSSQGGYFAFILAGMTKCFTKVVAIVPAGTDTLGYLAGRLSGWPRVVESQRKENRAAAEKWAPYFDAANFAPYVTCPIRVLCGCIDTTCPPTAVNAAYNALASKDKQIIFMPKHGHGAEWQRVEELTDWRRDERFIRLDCWRGETVNFRYEYQSKQGENFKPSWQLSKPEFTAKAGVMRSIRYTVKPHAATYGESPDRVEWGGATNLPPGGSCVAVGSLTVPASVKAVTYVHKFVDAKVLVNVIDRTLPPPSKWQYFTADFWHNPWSVARLTKTELWSKAHLDACRPFLELTASLGCKTIMTTLSDLPWCHQCYDGNLTMIRHIKNPVTNQWTFDYSIFDTWVKLSLETGNGPYINCFSLVPWGYEVTWEDETGHPTRIVAKPGTKEFEDYWTPFLIDFREHLRKHGWLKYTQLGFDERDPNDMLATINFIQKVAPEFGVGAGANVPQEKFGNLQIRLYSQYLPQIDDAYLKLACERRRKGEGKSVYYVCCVPDVPNMFPWSDPEDAFWLAVMPIAKGLDGFGRWTINSWPKDPYNDASYYGWPGRDSYLVYPDCSPTWALLQLQNGIQNGEKWRILEDAGGVKAAQLSSLAPRFDIKAALKKKDGDFHGLVTDVLRALND